MKEIRESRERERESEREESYFVCNKVQRANLGGEKSFVQTVMQKGRGTRCGAQGAGAHCMELLAGAQCVKIKERGPSEGLRITGFGALSTKHKARDVKSGAPCEEPPGLNFMRFNREALLKGKDQYG